MKRSPLLVSLLISLGTGVIAGFLTFGSMAQYRNVSPAIFTSGMGISCCLVISVYADGNCLVPYLSEKSKSGSVETVPDPACSELFLAGFLF